MGLVSFFNIEDSSPIDMFNWKKFPLNQIFIISLSDGDNQAKLLDEGNIPLVSSGKNNNGICKYIEHGDGISKIYKGNVITVDMFGKAFYQPHDFFAVSHGRVNILIPITEGPFAVKLNKYIGLFITSCIEERIRANYSFGEMCNSSALAKEEIYLPTNHLGCPDYVAMEEYIKNIYSKALDILR